MNRMAVANVAVPLPIEGLFDYRIPGRLARKVQAGVRVLIRFNNKMMVGFVVSLKDKSKFSKLSSILSLIDEGPVFSSSALRLARNIKDYYVCSWGEALEIMLPHALRYSKNIKAITNKKQELSKKGRPLFVEYESDEKLSSFLINEVKMRIETKKRVIFIVPELKMIDSARCHLDKIEGANIAIMHGKLSNKESLKLWNDLSLNTIDVVVGTRSSIFLPIQNLGLLVVKGENDYAYKGDQVPYYHAVNVALMRAGIEKCDVILSSQIPSLETFYSIKKNRITKKSIAGTRSLPKIQFTSINFKDKIDVVLANEIEIALMGKEQILILLNRKGFATSVFCKKCNETLKCSKCSCNLRFDYSQKVFTCPRCDSKIKSTEICPKCNREYIKYRGVGIEKLESNIKRLFPSAKIVSINELENGLKKDYDILISTSKILNYDGFNTGITIIWDFDSLINVGDFRSGEQAYRLLAGLLLRTQKKMIISTSLNQDFPFFQSLNDLNTEQFYNSELKSRSSLKLPPYYHLGLVSIRSIKKENTDNTSLRLQDYFTKQNKRDVFTMPLSLKRRSKIRGKYYSYLLLKSKKASVLNKVAKEGIGKIRSSSVIITVDIDPIQT